MTEEAAAAAAEGELLSLVPADPKHDVVLKCRNGRVRKPVDDIFVIFRVDLESSEPDAIAVAYSYNPTYAMQFVVQVACKDLYGKFWDEVKNGNPCFDLYDTDGSERPLPEGPFMMWDDDTLEDDVDEQGMPIPKTPTLNLYGDGPEHKTIRRYKIAQLQLTINDMLSIETEGDRFFVNGGGHIKK